MKVTKKLVDEQLRYSWTPKGVKQWWDRPYYQLGGKTPHQAWEAGEKQKVYDLAVDGRSMICT